ncbi:uracil-DNA glycosylase family protein [Actibacterium sp. XHP0104]|uniref:uracil-DNA glycosylase family protein n=1 Tax=Actibacterium sp. XHP0104 TaxID=2984335 RepID=UPI0021E94C1F|nr:uracil-DNA glycosylase family protein [Actibacterium sp. XHP0104]MCV2880431.1 uracil-DNA glycosylase family protein [Actibacterium sp. XHP0104]
MSEQLDHLKARLRACSLCATRFAATASGHQPRPVVWFGQGARILVAGQAPGMRVHEAGKPFLDASGDRLRDWMGVTADQFYDQSRVAVIPMAFCFPGYDARGSDLPPPPLCRDTWHDAIMQALGGVDLMLVIGGYAQAYHLGAAAKGGVTRTVQAWRDHAPRVFPLPHPSWRNTAWLRKNPWFEAELLPALRARVKEVIND